MLLSLLIILSVCYSSEHRRSLELLGKRWETTQRNCDYYKTCDFNKNRDVPICYCDSVCMFYKDCCHEAFNDSLSELGHLNGEDADKYRIMNDSQCDFIHKSHHVGARVVSSCSIHEASGKCFESRNKTKLEDVIFVTGSNGITYQNRFCALCNGIRESTAWSLSFKFTIPSYGAQEYSSCNVSVFENQKYQSNFEMANFLIKHCIYNVLAPSGIEPRFCVRDKWKCSPIFLDDHPFNESTNPNPLTLTALFKFDSNPRHGVHHNEIGQKKDTSAVQEMNARLSLKNTLLVHTFSMSCNYTLDLDELHMLFKSVDQYFEESLSGIKLEQPFFIDYKIDGLDRVIIDLNIVAVADKYLEYTKFDLARKWFNRLKIKYKVSMYHSKLGLESEEILYEVSTVRSKHYPECFNCSHAKLRYYPNFMVVDDGVEIFGKFRAAYDNEDSTTRKTAFTAVMCDVLVISLTLREDDSSVTGSCLPGGDRVVSGGLTMFIPAWGYHTVTFCFIITLLMYIT